MLLSAVRASYVLEMNDWPSVFLFDGCSIQSIDYDVWQLFAKTDRPNLFMGNHTQNSLLSDGCATFITAFGNHSHTFAPFGFTFLLLNALLGQIFILHGFK